MFPTIDQIKLLHEKYAPSQAALDLVFTHCQIVYEIAQELIRLRPELKVDHELIRAGCLLHDIGAYQLFTGDELNEEKYITHGVEGYKILKSEGFDESLCLIASHHTGMGLSKEDIQDQSLPLPHEDFLADTIEQQLVMYADKFHSKVPQFNTYEAYLKFTSQFSSANAAQFESFSQLFGIPEIENLAIRYGHPII